jgi:FMN-dependent NADH-azoreductase
LISNADIKNLYKGLLNDKEVYLLMVRGNMGYDVGDFYEHMDFQTNYLKTVYGIIGIDKVKHTALNGAGMGEDAMLIARKMVSQLLEIPTDASVLVR